MLKRVPEAKTAMENIMCNLRKLCLALDGKPVKLKTVVITLENLMDLRLRHDLRVKDPSRSNRGFDLLGPFKGLRVDSVKIRADFMDTNPVAWNHETLKTHRYTREVKAIMEGLGERPEDPRLETWHQRMHDTTLCLRNHRALERFGPCPAMIEFRKRLEIIRDDYSQWPFTTEDPLGEQELDEVVLAREGLHLRPNFGTSELDGRPALGHQWYMVKANRHMDYVPHKPSRSCKFPFACRDGCRTSLRVTTSVIRLSAMVVLPTGIVCDLVRFSVVHCGPLHWIWRCFLFALWILNWFVMAKKGFRV